MSEKKDAREEQHQEGYKRMLERVRDILEEAEESLRPGVHEAIERARERAVELGELTREEAQRISEYLRRDVEETAAHMSESREEFRDWLALDLTMMEQKVVQMLMSIADRTDVELAQLRERATESAFYHTGELAAPGTFQCTECGELIHLKRTGHLPPCPKCGGSRYKRIPSAVM